MSEMNRRKFISSAAATPALAAAPAILTTKSVAGQSAEKIADLTDLFRKHLQLCKLQPGETFLFYADAQYQAPEYIDAAIGAARSLGAAAFTLRSPSDLNTGSSGGYSEGGGDMLLGAFKSADLVYGRIPLYTDAHNEALRSGTRTLSVSEPVANLRRMFPDEAVIKRTYAGAKRMQEAKEIRVTDDSGSDFTLRKDGRKGHAQVGISDKPGRWDHWPSGLVACGPLEDSAEGVYVVNPGDVILGLRIYCTNQVKIHMSKGKITRIEGGYDAQMIRERLDRFLDAKTPGQLSDPYRIAHAGWGTEHRAQWQTMGMDSESIYGNVMVSIGRNMFDSADPYAGLGGKNYTPVHIDICCRNKKLYLDGELIVDNNRLVPSELA